MREKSIFVLWTFIILVNVFQVSSKESPGFSYEFAVQPIIFPNSNVSFAFRAFNSDPSNSYIFSFSISPLSRNETISVANSTKLSPKSNFLELITLPIAALSFETFKLGIKTVKLNETHEEVAKETFLKLNVDVRQSSVKIRVNRENNFETGDTVKFSIVVLDKYLKPLSTNRTLDISVWSLQPKYHLIDRWSNLKINPTKPYITGKLEIPPSYKLHSEFQEVYGIFATIDERSEDDDSRKRLSVPVTFAEHDILKRANKINTFFYSYDFQMISAHPKTPEPLYSRLNLKAKIINPIVTYKNSSYTLDIRATNSFGHPVEAGICLLTFQRRPWDRQLKRITLDFEKGRILNERNFLEDISPNWTEDMIFSGAPVVSTRIQIACKDNLARPGLREATYETLEVSMRQYDYIIDHVFMEGSESAPNGALVMVIRTKDKLPLGEGADGNEVEIKYNLSGNSSSSNKTYTERIVHRGVVEHKLKYSSSDSDLSSIVVNYKGSLLTIKQNSSSRPFRQERFVVPGETVVLPIFKHIPYSSRIQIVDNRRGEVTEKMYQPVFFSPKGQLDYIGFMNYTVETGTEGSTINFVENDHLLIVDKDASESELNLMGKAVPGEEVTYTPEINGNGIIGPGTFAVAPTVSSKVLVRFGDIGSPGLVPRSRCTITSETNVSTGLCRMIQNSEEDDEDPCIFGECKKIKKLTKKVKAVRERSDTEAPRASLHYNLNAEETRNQIGKTGLDGIWEWKASKSGDSARLQITTRLPSDIVETQRIFGISIDKKYGYRLSKPFELQPDVPFALHILVDAKEVTQGDTNASVIKLTVFNNLKRSLDNLTVVLEDTSGVIRFPENANKSQVTLNVPSVAALNHSRLLVTFNADKVGEVNLHANAVEGTLSAERKINFAVIPVGKKVLQNFPFLINHTKGREFYSSRNVSLPPLDTRAIPGTEKIEVSSVSNFLFHNNIPELIRLDNNLKSKNVSRVQSMLTLLDLIYAIGEMPEQLENHLIADFSKEVSSISDYVGILGSPSKDESAFLSESGKTGVSLQMLVRIRKEYGKYGSFDSKKFTGLVEYLLNLVESKNNNTAEETVNEKCRQKFVVYNSCQVILGLHSAKEFSGFSGAEEIEVRMSNVMDEMMKKLLKETENSTNSFDLNIVTYMLSELKHPKAEEYFKRLEESMKNFISSKSPLIIVEGGKTSSECETRIWETLEATSYALVNYLKQNKILQAYQLARGLVEVFDFRALQEGREKYFSRPMWALGEFAAKVSYSTYSEETISVELGNVEGREVELRCEGRGFALGVVTLTYFVPL